MIPELNFIWSFPYQASIHSVFVENEKFDLGEYSDYVESFIEKVKSKWNKNGSEILKYCEKLTGLKWKKEEIKCFVVKISPFPPISDPLTIPIQLSLKKKNSIRTVDSFIDILVHELIHNLFFQNEEKIISYFKKYLWEKYKNLHGVSRRHIPVHAVHKEIFEEFFSKRRFEKEIEKSSNYPLYKKSWEIVLKEGSKNILFELKKNVRV